MVSVLSRSTMAGGVFAGALNPNHSDSSKPAMPDSVRVGISGSAARRWCPIEASAFSLPALTCGTTGDAGVNCSVTRPASRSIVAGALPLYGTCAGLEPVVRAKDSAQRGVMGPEPEDCYE